MSSQSAGTRASLRDTCRVGAGGVELAHVRPQPMAEAHESYERISVSLKELKKLRKRATVSDEQKAIV